MSMRTRPRYRAAVAVGATAVMVLAGCGAFSADSAPETVVVGVDLELTGAGEALGAIHRQALELRVEQINQQGLLGNRRIELEFRDNRSNPATSALNVGELADDPDVVAIITGACAGCAESSMEVAEARGIPLVSLSPADPAGSVDQHRYFFKLGPNADHNAAALIGELGSRVQTIGLAAGVDPYGDAGVREVTDAANRAGIDVVATVRIPAEATTDQLSAPAREIATWQSPDTPPPLFGQAPEPPSGPDAVVIWLPAPQAGQFAVALRDAGYDKRLLLDAVGADELFLSGNTAAALDGATLVFTEALVMDTVLATSPAKAARKAWFNSYSARYGTYHAASSFAADALQLIAEAINQIDSTSRDDVRDAIERTQMDGLTGRVRITPDNHSGLTAAALITLVASSDRWQTAS